MKREVESLTSRGIPPEYWLTFNVEGVPPFIVQPLAPLLIMRSCGYTASEVRAASLQCDRIGRLLPPITAPQLMSATFPLSQIREAGFGCDELLQAGVSQDALVAAGFAIGAQDCGL